ncbi:META domain-containing protein [Neisseria mucosa]|uniref:META domain-containing protein n=1 Tax=Neisseria mucosa TaxID=488 RepID=UPI00051DF3E0|nr:META domain-containing protein [Neisseria mucosa]KGJ33105.1 hypothetical protein ES17_02865 [Neisseria mucosa]
MKTLISAMIGAFVLAACSTPADKLLPNQPQASSDKSSESHQMKMPTLAAKWRVVAFNKFTEKDLASTDAYLDLSEMPKAYGKMGCNGMMFQANTIGSDRIDFGHIAVSMMLCEDMKLEDAFLRRQGIWNYRFDGNDLILEQKGISIRLRRE